MINLSIVIPALNEDKYLPALLTSLAGQTRTDFEVIVVDGNSKDKTVEAARRFAAQLPRLQVFRSERASLPLQRNLGARAASSAWLVFVDADSVLLSDFVERLYQFIGDRAPRFFTVWFRPDSEAPGDAILVLISNLLVEVGNVLHRPLAPGPLSAVRRDVFELAGGYSEHLTFGEDYDFTQKVIEQGFKLQILRETVAVLSLRRARKLGWKRFVWFYALVSLRRAFLNSRSPEKVRTYVMGGQYFDAGGRG